jgi:uncharacterized protein YndB with AHSA1/START domain
MSFVPLTRLAPPRGPWSTRRRERIAASPARVWQALTAPAELAAWWADAAEVDLQPGGRFAFGGPTVYGWRSPADEGASPAAAGGLHAGEVLAVEPETRLEFTWHLGGAATWVVWELANVLEQTEVTVTQSGERPGGWDAAPGAPDWWWIALPALRSRVEKGQADLRLDYPALRAARELAFTVGVSTFPWVVWHKLTDPGQLERWWGRKVEVDLRSGGTFRLGLDGPGPERIDAVTAGQHLAHDWVWQDGTRSRVEWTIAETEEDTVVSLRDLGPWPPAAGREALGIERAALLLDLKQMSERGITPREYQDG